MMLARMQPPEFPAPLGVLRKVDAPTLEVAVREQIDEITARKSKGDLRSLIYSGTTWEVK